MTHLLWWALFFGLFIILELSSPGFFFFLSFAVGALAAATASLLSVPLSVELGIFGVVSVGAFLFLKRVAARVAHQNKIRTNVYALQGKKGVVVDQITPLTRGWIKIEGELWAAAPADNMSIEKDSVVEVVSTAGSHVKVKKLDLL